MHNKRTFSVAARGGTEGGEDARDEGGGGKDLLHGCVGWSEGSTIRIMLERDPRNRASLESVLQAWKSVLGASTTGGACTTGVTGLTS